MPPAMGARQGRTIEGAESLRLLADLVRYESALMRNCESQHLAAVTLYIRDCIALTIFRTQN